MKKEKKDKPFITCLNSSCLERFSLCCNAVCRATPDPEIMLGVPPFTCKKCGKRWEGGKCQMEDKLKAKEFDWRKMVEEQQSTIQWWVKRAAELEKKLKKDNETLALMTKCRKEETLVRIKLEKRLEVAQAKLTGLEKVKYTTDK
jgi:septal ring factor EnvC (AmiA/AmiB activator)